MANNAAAASAISETQAKKKPVGKDDGKLRFGFIGTGSPFQKQKFTEATKLNTRKC